MGHEFLGVVEDVGRGVSSVKRGDRVLASCTIGCGQCVACRNQLYSGCTVVPGGGGGANVFGVTPTNPGGQAEAVLIPYADANLFPIPESVEDERARFLTDILPTGYMGAEWADVGPGDVVVVFGCGPVGTFAQMGAQVRGAAVVLAVDLDESRLEAARARGCETLNPAKADLLETVMSLTRGRGADSVIEAVGKKELVAQAAELTRPGGRVAVIGVLPDAELTLPWFQIFGKNITIRTGLVNPPAYMNRLLPLIESERIDPTVIVSHRLDLSDGPEAYEIFARQEAMKVVLKP